MSETNIHIMPNNDLKKHIESNNCWCRPTANIEEPNVIIHKSLDGREVKELLQENKELLN